MSGKELFQFLLHGIGGFVVRGDDQDRIVSGDRAHDLRPFLSVQRHSYGVSMTRRRFQYHQILSGADILQKLRRQQP